MAQYKSGFKRQQNDRLFSYVLIGFAVTFFLVIVSLILFDVLSKDLTYESFDHVDNYIDITQMDESEYLVYFYSENCHYCNDIKPQVLEFADKNGADVKVYFLDAGSAAGENNIPGMDGTPTLLTVVDGRLVDMVSGTTSIIDIFDKINGGTYAYLN